MLSMPFSKFGGREGEEHGERKSGLEERAVVKVGRLGEGADWRDTVEEWGRETEAYRKTSRLLVLLLLLLLVFLLLFLLVCIGWRGAKKKGSECERG